MTEWPEDMGQKILIKMYRKNENGEIEKKPWKELQDTSPEVLRCKLEKIYQNGTKELHQNQQRSN